MFIKENFFNVLEQIKDGNNFGEPITLVGATKTIPVEIINEATSLGLKVVAENRVQEFNQKTCQIEGARQHFIGHLQSNKVKYLVGKVDLIHSVDSLSLAECISKKASALNVVQDVLIEVNVGGELSKSGFNVDNALSSLEQISKLDNLRIKGFMAMLPKSDDKEYLSILCKKMRALYDDAKKTYPSFEFLSMGMSSDYLIAIKNGSNMIRLGSTLFGKREQLTNL